jgi:hypothetical protein
VAVERVLDRVVADQMRFTFGHEYAHALLGHASYDSQSVGVTNAEMRAYSYEAEFEADLHALRNIEHRSKAFAITAEGALTTLLFLHFLEEVAPILGRKVGSISTTHPPARDRLLRLYESVRKRLSPNVDSPREMMMFGGEMKDMLIQRLKGQRPDLLQCYGSVYLPSYVGKRKRDRYDY